MYTVPSIHDDAECGFSYLRDEIMEWDLTSIGLVLIGSSITIAGIIIAVMLMGIVVNNAPFLLLTTAVIVVLSASLVVFNTPRSPPPL